MKRRVLLLEPNYKNKFPPIGLMKLSTYFRTRGDEVVFYKGDLRDFVIQQIVEECLTKLYQIDNSINWKLRADKITLYIKYRKKEFLNSINILNTRFLFIHGLNIIRNFIIVVNTASTRVGIGLELRLCSPFIGI